MNFPVKVYYPRENGDDKVLTANNQKEFDALTRMGWKTEKSK